MGLINSIGNKTALKKLRNRALQIDALKDTIASLTDEQLKEKTLYFKQQFENVTDLKEIEIILDKITNEAFAVCREAAKRVLNQFPYLVQIMGALAIHNGDIAEMKTGEGKTLTATMAVYTNALTGRGVHVITVNEYLAKRDAEWMGQIYRFLGLTVGCNLFNLTPIEKKDAYSCDITYTTNSELGFDYLRDNLAHSKEGKVQVKGLNFAVIDEADSILIDDAKTPLIISGGNSENMNLYMPVQTFVKSLIKNDEYEVDIQAKAAYLTSKGIDKAEHMFSIDNLYAIEHQNLLHCIHNALKANYIMQRNVEYIIKKDDVQLVDQNTGRVMEGRAYSDGLHQAIQAKENVKIKPETVTFASITYQNFFRLYNKLSGMTGTAKTEEIELIETYNMRVIEIPTNRPVVRTDAKDFIFGNKKAKYDAIVDEVIKRHETGQPILLGTMSVDTSYVLHRMLINKGLQVELLNAENDEREAEIVSLAGQIGAITIATNMAGRGTDIKLGEGVKELGGLCVIGSERHDSKRIDNQLRGRAGRQGDPGFSRFYVSLEDHLIVMDKAKDFSSSLYRKGLIESKSVAHNINRIQNRTESINFYSRKSLLEFDNVLSLQRYTMYNLRDQILDSKDLYEIVNRYTLSIVDMYVRKNIDVKNQKKYQNVMDFFEKELNLEGISLDETYINSIEKDIELKDALANKVKELINNKKEEYGEEIMGRIVNNILLSSIDRNWPAQITRMDHLKSGVNLRSYEGKNPITLYKNEAYKLFDKMFNDISKQALLSLLHVQINIQPVQVEEEINDGEKAQ